jgi:hypothetical protein
MSASNRIYHVSEEPDIRHFAPRPPPSLDAGVTDHVVWAISERLLHNYLLPRDCPRVTFYAKGTTTEEDAARFMIGTTARHVVAVESGWLPRIQSTRLYRYEFPPETFVPADHGAGYLVSREAVSPIGVVAIPEILPALAARDVELRVVPSLWKLRDAVYASTLAFSFIRMRHAAPRSYDSQQKVSERQS